MPKQENNFFWLLGGLLITLLIAPIASDNLDRWLALVYAATLLVGVWSLRSHTRVYPIAWVLVAAMFATAFWNITDPGEDARLSGQTVFLLFGIVAMVFVFRAVLRHPVASMNRIAGAICVYLLIGLNFALIYAMALVVNNDAFTGIDLAASENQIFLDLVYYSFVTLTTLGYGDVTPQSNLAQALAYLEAACGVLYIAILVAALVGAYAAEGAKRGN